MLKFPSIRPPPGSQPSAKNSTPLAPSGSSWNTTSRRSTTTSAKSQSMELKMLLFPIGRKSPISSSGRSRNPAASARKPNSIWPSKIILRGTCPHRVFRRKPTPLKKSKPIPFKSKCFSRAINSKGR